MKTFLRRRTLSALIVFTLSCVFHLCSFSQTFVGESGNPADNAAYIAATVTVTPPGGLQAGDLVVIYAHHRANSGTLSITTTGGQTWTSEAQHTLTTNQRIRIFWCQFNGTWTANPVVGGGNGTSSLTAVMYVYRPSYSGNRWVKFSGPNNANVAASTVISVPGINTTGVNNNVTMAFWGNTNANTWGTLVGAGWSKTGLGNQYRNTGTGNQSHTAAYRILAVGGVAVNVSQTQSSSLVTGICSMTWNEVPPDLCSAPVTLTSSTSCTNVSSHMFGATLAPAPTITAPDCATGATRDVWYNFVAQTTNPTITLSSIDPFLLGNTKMQLLSNNCGATFTSFFCSTTTGFDEVINADFLTPGTTYFIRVYSTAGAPPSAAVAGFDICIQDPVPDPPVNDECTGAINLPIWNSCNNIPGNMAGATVSSTPLGGTCTGPNAYDVWYKFTAINSTATITMTNTPASPNNFTNGRIEILSGNCGSLTSIFCGTSPLAATGLTAGNTYYVRVYSTTGPAPDGNARFNICAATTNAPVRFGNSYVNISKKTTGGVVEPGDTLEVRMTVNHTSGTMYRLRYVDNVPSNTAMLTGPTDRIRIITNEGLFYKEYTLAGGDDAGTYLASPPMGQYNVRLNLTFGTAATGVPPNNTSNDTTNTRGQMASANNPRGGGGLLFATAFRVVVTGNVGDTITLNPGQFLYTTTFGSSDVDVVLTATPFNLLISEPLSLCANSIGVNNASEFGGTFGSGTTLNRSTDLSFPISNYSFVSEVNNYNGVGDGRYALVKNLSPRSSTLSAARRQPNCSVAPSISPNDPVSCNNRMYGHWYIDGDHTGTNNAAGNTPPATSTNASYMLMVNADYVASEIYQQTINNLCPDTYYEFSAWVKNICATCGIDSLGRQFNVAMPPALQNGYPGVYPNLSFALDGLDYYNTGEIDTLGWLKKGFVFRTGSSQTSATFSIRNNSQGGGGNDWVLDDIAVATCLPTMSYSPTINPNVCYGNAITIADTISSFFDNYTTYKWQRSTDGGATWIDITADTTLADTNYYITSYTIPPANTTLADSGDLYRVVVATTPANLINPNCNISDGVTITLAVNDCGVPLKTDLLSFNGKLIGDKSHLNWTTSKEDQPVLFDIERSPDGNSFTWVGSVNGYNNPAEQLNNYSFVDPEAVSGKVYYRLAMKEPVGTKKYSRIIQLSKTGHEGFSLLNVVNPFTVKLDFDISAQNDTRIEAELLDLYGKVVAKSKYMVRSGTNTLSLPNTESLSAGTYILRIKNNEQLIIRKVLKQNF
ncbi:MAG: T9SS type A sorting domain-containing protein [Chitinophagaceae bacterium]|nr:T9SS type A sorting domain-containing protein [Chitinophagaceae bacterium]